MKPPTLKQKLGCWLHERPHLERALRAPPGSTAWLDLCNRHETVTCCADGLGRVCRWQNSSLLTACRMFPRTGGRLLERANREHPFGCAAPLSPGPVSVIIPVRGRDRVEAIAFVASALRSISGSDSEVLICEHAAAPLLKREWPAGIRHVAVPAAEGEAFNKSKALNAGARLARHPVLLLHDADVWPCADYVSTCLEKMEREGWDALRPIRFLFLLDEVQTGEVLAVRRIGTNWAISQVQQNNPGLATFIRRETYFEIGGHDERFTGWGWEDVEFLDRLQTRNLYPGSFLPAIHLWHAPSRAKQNPRESQELVRELLKIPVEQRIEEDRRQLEQGGRA